MKLSVVVVVVVVPSLAAVAVVVAPLPELWLEQLVDAYQDIHEADGSGWEGPVRSYPLRRWRLG